METKDGVENKGYVTDPEKETAVRKVNVSVIGDSKSTQEVHGKDFKLDEDDKVYTK